MLPVCAEAEMDVSNIRSLPDSQVVDEEHYWDFVTFSLSDSTSFFLWFARSHWGIQVQGRLFRVPKYRFVEEPEHFCKEYDLDFKLEKEYGAEGPHFYVIQLNVDVNHFRAFLKVLYPR
jgi:hypothetical protein